MLYVRNTCKVNQISIRMLYVLWSLSLAYLKEPPEPTMIIFLPVQVKDLWCCLGLNTHLPFKVFYNLNVSMILCHQYWPGVKSGDYIQFLEQRSCLLFLPHFSNHFKLRSQLTATPLFIFAHTLPIRTFFAFKSSCHLTPTALFLRCASALSLSWSTILSRKEIF